MHLENLWTTPRPELEGYPGISSALFQVLENLSWQSECTSLYFSICLLMSIWVIHGFKLLGTKLPWTFFGACLLGDTGLTSRVNTLEWHCRFTENYTFSFSRHCWTVFQSHCSIFNSPHPASQVSLIIPDALLPCQHLAVSVFFIWAMRQFLAGIFLLSCTWD